MTSVAQGFLRAVFMLNFWKMDNYQLCEMVSTWKNGRRNATRLHAVWTPNSGASSEITYTFLCAYRYYSDGTEKFWVTLELFVDGSPSVLRDSSGNRKFLDMLAAEQLDHGNFNRWRDDNGDMRIVMDRNDYHDDDYHQRVNHQIYNDLACIPSPFRHPAFAHDSDSDNDSE